MAAAEGDFCNSFMSCFGNICEGSGADGDINDERQIFEATKNKLQEGVSCTKFSRSIPPRVVAIKISEDCQNLHFENADASDSECRTYSLATLGVRRATDPDPEVKHFAGSKILRDNLDPSMALRAFIIEAPDKVTVNLKVEDEIDAERIIAGFKLLIKDAKSTSFSQPRTMPEKKEG